MSVQKVSLIQGTDEWLEWRKRGIGASEISACIGENPYCSPKQLLNKKLGINTKKDSDFSLSRMERGRNLEPLIRDEYINQTGNWVEPVCVFNEKYPWLLASLDGLSEDGKLVVEIKAPSNKVHGEALDGKVVGYYYWQVLGQLLVADAELGHFVSYSDDPAFGIDTLAIVPVERNKLKEFTIIDRTKRWWDDFLRQRELHEKFRRFRSEIDGSPKEDCQ